MRSTSPCGKATDLQMHLFVTLKRHEFIVAFICCFDKLFPTFDSYVVIRYTILSDWNLWWYLIWLDSKVSGFQTVFGKKCTVNGSLCWWICRILDEFSCSEVKARFGWFLSRYCPDCTLSRLHDFFRLGASVKDPVDGIFSVGCHDVVRTTAYAAVDCTWREIPGKCRSTAHVYFHSAKRA